MERVELDIRGQICPSCLLLTLRETNRHIARLCSGEAELVVTTDDRLAVTTIPEAVVRMGLRAEVSPQPGGYSIRVSAP